MIGAVTIGYFQTAKIERVSNNFILEECWSRIIDDVNTLASIRKDRIADLAASREEELSRQVYAVELAVESGEPLSEETRKRISDALKRAAAYRASHPFQLGEAEIDAAVQKALSFASTNRP
jgi:hypothetical protein